MYGVQVVFFSELFGTRVPYTGIAVGQQVAAVIGGGRTPAIAASLVVWASGAVWPIVVCMVMLVPILIALSAVPETEDRDITGPARLAAEGARPTGAPIRGAPSRSAGSRRRP